MTVIADEVVCAPRAGTLYDVLDLILDRGIVIDVFLRVSLVGIEILKVDARIVVASVDTYLRFAEICNRLDLDHDSTSRTVPELFGGAGSVGRAGAKKAAHSVGGKVKDALGISDGHDDEEEDRKPARRRSSAKSSGSKTRSRHRDDEG
ncbi:gas vesicle protein GvpJ [Actinacidiphila bryophytorum]|uniref:Gas vesicle protein A n=1 Tax=Actinacidiphila bryophytorum TaxID=1436133 RepID=A0A9W4H2S6_9ACTN|nr:gas vesicle protein GvpJ [Actinacidiphila bryophytorum]MBM9436955.1 gas vesicle structural protein GvpA [Actinacidiphila bryophytorum]MBN6546086.1 gas vesicle structural protein GvpA [Actinacidiphila bryophytorum]CAG7645962.1 putative gas vesicle structural protein 2 [Actinacidiphila bryophytorum]